MQTLIKWIALAGKIIAAVAWLGVAQVMVSLDLSDLLATSQPMYRDAPEDWGTPAFYWRTSIKVLVICGCFVLSALPNRWLVSRRPVFWMVLIFTLVPMANFLAALSKIHEASDLLWAFFGAIVLSPLLIFLPVSLALSFWRHKKGERVTYV